jgi:hypothetical protein
MQLLSPDAAGIGGALYAKYGMNDWFNVVAEVSGSGHPAKNTVLVGGRVGAEYVFDILRWVPYVGGLAGSAVVFTSGNSVSPRLDLEVPFGLDYQLSRSFAVGGVGKLELLIGSDLRTAVGGFLRAEYFFGF